MYEGGGAPLGGMWGWFENFNQFVSMSRGRACAAWADRTWNDDHQSPGLSPRVWQQGDWIRNYQAVRHRLIARFTDVLYIAKCRPRYCQENDAERLSSPRQAWPVPWVWMRGSEIGSLIKLSRLSLPSRAALRVLGHTGSRERIWSQAVRGKRWMRGPGTKTRSWRLLWSVLSVTRDSDYLW